jgi:hypothetical protein
MLVAGGKKNLFVEIRNIEMSTILKFENWKII